MMGNIEGGFFVLLGLGWAGMWGRFLVGNRKSPFSRETVKIDLETYVLVISMVCLGLAGVFAGFRIMTSGEIWSIGKKEVVKAEYKTTHAWSDGVFKRISVGVVGTIVRDTSTGCEFILSPAGQMMPRPDSTGKQVCRK